MHIMEKGSQRYVLDPQTGKLVKFDPLFHDRKVGFGQPERVSPEEPRQSDDPSDLANGS